MFPDDAHALGSEGVTQAVVLVVEVVVGLKAEAALAVEQVFQVKVADEVGVARVVGVVAVAEVTVEQQSVVEQLAGQRHIHLDVAEVALVGAHIGRDAQVVGHLAQDVAQLACDGR